MVAVILCPPWKYSTRRFATHLHNPLVMHKAFQLNPCYTYKTRNAACSCLAHSTTIAINDFGSEVVIYLQLIHTVPVHEHACARAGAHLCTR